MWARVAQRGRGRGGRGGAAPRPALRPAQLLQLHRARCVRLPSGLHIRIYYIYSQQGRQMEPGNLVLRRSVPIEIFPIHTFRQTPPMAACVECQNSTLFCASLLERGNIKCFIKYFHFLRWAPNPRPVALTAVRFLTFKQNFFTEIISYHTHLQVIFNANY